MAIEFRLPKPQPKQDLFLRDKHEVVIFGGSRGGGKSWSIDAKASIAGFKYPGFISTIVRRTYPELRDNHVEPMRELFRCGRRDALAVYNQTDKEMRLPNGSRIRFRTCDNENALTKIQGQQMNFLFIDEATNIPEEWIKKMRASVRGVNNYPKRMYLTCNPGGVSHGYIRRLMEGRFEEGENPDDYIFIGATLFDNKILMQNDPDYLARLESLPPSLKEAWLYGNWQIFEGAFFTEFREAPDPQKCLEAGISTEDAKRQHRWTHVIEPFDIPIGWKIYRSYDFGYNKPFSVGWFAVDYDETAYRILELYGCTKTPNEGVKWSPSEQMERIAKIENEHPWLRGRQIHGVADPAIWEGSHGISIIEEADKRHLWFDKGINDRIPGWMQVRERLKFDQNGFAKLYFFNTCKAAIRTIPLMMYDEHNPEDLDSSLEDHCPDEIRYFCMHRVIAPRIIETVHRPIFDPLNQYKR